MRFLLDTHTFIWYVANEGQLTTSVLEIVNDANNDILLSVASLGEAVVASLRLHHRYPFDLLLISQVIVEQLPILSIDSAFDVDPMQRLWNKCMKQEEKGDSELFYAFFSLIKPRKSTSSKDEWQSHVLPHSAIAELAPNLWHVTGILPSSTMVPREMVVYKLPDSSLLIHSAIALNEVGMSQLESLGVPKILIVPNRIHRLDAGVYKQRYPQLTIICPAAAKPYVEEVVAVDGIAEEVLPKYDIICHEPAGIRPQELVYELPLPTGKALIFTDILFNLNKLYLQQNSPKGQFTFQWLGASAIGANGFFGMTFLGRQFFLRDRHAYRQWLETLADSIHDLQVISVAHGSPIIANCNQRLREAAARLS